MLPSLGCFSSLECPFYNGGAGQCSRPYCHYKHAKRDPNAPSKPAEDILGPVPVVGPGKSEDSGGTSNDSKSRAPLYRALVEAAPAYNPTPIALLKSSHIPIPYTPMNPTRSTAVKKKPSSEYVPLHVGTSRPSYPPYSPSSISTVSSQGQSAPIDPLKNPLYEIYGPEGAQYSPNDVEPITTSYSYAPESSSSYSPYSPYTPYAEYVPSKVNYDPQFSPQDSQLSDDDDNVDLAIETAAQTNGDPGGGESLIDFDLSELDNLDLDFVENDDNEKPIIKSIKDQKSSDDTVKEKSFRNTEVKRSKDDSDCSNSSSSRGEKRRSNTSSSGETKRHKLMHETDKVKSFHETCDKSKSSHGLIKSDLKEKKTTSSNSKKSSSSSSSNQSRKSDSHGNSKSKPSSSSKSSKSSSNTEERKSGPSDLKSHRSSSSSSSCSSKHKDMHTEKSSSKEKDRNKHHGKDKDPSKDRNNKKLSHHSSSVKGRKNIQHQNIENEIKMIELELDASLEDEDTIEQQCFEMFSEYSETIRNQPAAMKTEDERVTVNDEPTPSALSKKRVAHQASHSSLQPNPKPVPTLAKKCSPYQIMRDRWEMLKKEKAQSLDAKTTLVVAPSSVPKASTPVPYSSTNAPQASLPSAIGKKRIAGVPNVAMLLKPPSTSSTSTSSMYSKTTGSSPTRFYNKTSQRIDEYGRVVKVRVAHAPNMDAPVMQKPVVNPSDCRKFKVATRQSNVNKLFQAYLDAGFADASHDMALESERTSTQGTESLGVYSHRIIQILKDLRACAETSQNGPKLDGMSGIPNRVVSHNAMLAGKLGTKVSWSIQSAKKETESKSHLSLYQQLQGYILTKEQLVENGFPMPCAEKGCASIKPSSYRVIKQPTDPRQKICVRCLKPYTINKRGEQVKEEECFYHWGRKLTTRQYRQAETKYTCCDGTGGGCSVSPYHVFEQNWEKTTGFMSTLSKPRMETNPGVYALDCEMCYTTAGLELTRVTVVKEDLSVAYEALVKPAHKILDYNTRYSGITEDDLKSVNTNILQVQATLLGMFCDKTILIGHSLESDMKALKLIHPTVVDTSVVFPHKMGPPQKRALRNLAADYLKKIIQNDVGGHDSKEDAVAALELMLWKLREDEKTR